MAKLFYGTQGNDHLAGTDINDIFQGSTGNDVLLGLAGYDIADYSDLRQTITMLAAGLVQKGDLGTDQLSGIEEIIGAVGQANTIDAAGVQGLVSLRVNLSEHKLAVNNIPVYGDRHFTIKNFVNVLGTNVRDKIIGDGQNNCLQGRGGNDFIDGGNGNDIILGGSGNDRILGNDGDDFLDGGKGNDFLDGGAGNDIFQGSVGRDTLVGGEGYDVVDYSHLDKAVTMLPAGLTSKGGVGKDYLSGIEEVIGATGKANTINASGVKGGVSMNIHLADHELVVKHIPVYGDRRFTVKNFVNVLGSEGADTIVGSRGNNHLQGNGGDDFLDGGKGNDFLDGGAGNDIFQGSVGRDTLVGGEGYDVVDYSHLDKAVTMLPAGLTSKGGVGKDYLSGIEEVIGATGKANTINASGVKGGVSMNIHLADHELVVKHIPVYGDRRFTVKNFVNVLGSEGADTIVGDVHNNYFNGNGGDDFLNGAGGKDILLGGAGSDTFALADSHGGFYNQQNSLDHAVIRDFSVHEDLVQLSDHGEYRLTNSNGNSYLDQYIDGHWDKVAVLEHIELNQLDLNNYELFHYV